MTDERLQELLSGYLAGAATEADREEIALFVSVLSTEELEEALDRAWEGYSGERTLPADRSDHILQAILGTPIVERRIVRFHVWRWVAAAAPKKDRVDPKVREQLDILFFQQAARYVASSKKEYLTHIVDAVQFYASGGPNWEAELKTHVFQHFIA